MSNSKVQSVNIQKREKREAKKRKLEAFLNLVRKGKETASSKKRPLNTFAESYKALKDELKKYHKTKNADPLFYPTDEGKKALVQFLLKDELSSQSPLFIEDIYHLLLKSILGNFSPFPLQWAKLEHANQVSKTVLIVIERFSEENVTLMKSSFNQNFLLSFVFEITSKNQSFGAELSSYQLRNDCCKRIEKKTCSVDQSSIKESHVKDKQYKVSKLHLLLSPIQLALEHYPLLPGSEFDMSKSDDYCFTKNKYTPVHADSPMFAIDCEMCRTTTGKQEVTRVAIVNENLETVYHSLVKPDDEIVDYLTRYSGITEKMLRDVNTRLSDVQRDIQNLLPSDAILCGQSLNCDLHALKMIHPYVIDTSVIYNVKGIRNVKPSLRRLAAIHLKETIQGGKNGHSPIEDSIATMELVQLKLKNSLGYGDAVLSPGVEYDIDIPDKKYQIAHTNLLCKDCGFFPAISKFYKKVCLIGDENSLDNYNPTVITDNISKVNASGLKNVIKATVENLNDSDFIISHLVFDKENDAVKELNDELKEVYNRFPKKTLFIIFMSNAKKQVVPYIRHNFCMVNVKNH